MTKRHRPGFPLAGDWLAVHQRRGNAPGSEHPSAMRTCCRRWQGARSLMAVGRSSHASARDERAMPRQTALIADPKTGTSADPKNGLFGRYPLGVYISNFCSLSAQPWTYTVRCPRSLENLHYKLAEVSFSTPPSACRSVMVLRVLAASYYSIRPVPLLLSPRSGFIFPCDYCVVRGSDMSSRPVEMRNSVLRSVHPSARHCTFGCVTELARTSLLHHFDQGVEQVCSTASGTTAISSRWSTLLADLATQLLFLDRSRPPVEAAGRSVGTEGSAILFFDGYGYMRLFSSSREVCLPGRSDVFPDRDNSARRR